MQWIDTLDFFWDSLPEGDKVGSAYHAAAGCVIKEAAAAADTS